MKSLKNIYARLGKKAFIALFVLAAVDVFVIAAPYYIRLIIPNVHEHLHVIESDYDSFIWTIGLVTLITQLPGGWLADKVSSKKLTALASLTTGLLTIWWGILILTGPDATADANGFIHANTNLLTQYFLIYIGWGISTTLIFWTPLWKLVSQQAKKEDQGVAYGLQGTLNGIIGIALIFLMGLGAVALVEEGFQGGFAIYIFLIAGYLIFTSFAIMKWVPEYTTKQKFALDFKIFWKVMKNPRIWLNAFLIMGMYMFQSIFAYFLLQYIRNISNAEVAVPIIAFTIIGGFRTYVFRFLVSTTVGRLADKAKSYIKILMLTLGAGFIITIIFLLLPGFGQFTDLNSDYQYFVGIMLIILYLLAGMLSWVMVTLRYATIGELPRPKGSYASVNGLISFVAFSPDFWFYLISSKIGKAHTLVGSTHTSQLGYTIIILIAIGVAIFGWLCGVVLFFWNKWELKKLNKTDYRWRELANV